MKKTISLCLCATLLLGGCLTTKPKVQSQSSASFYSFPQEREKVVCDDCPKKQLGKYFIPAAEGNYQLTFKFEETQHLSENIANITWCWLTWYTLMVLPANPASWTFTVSGELYNAKTRETAVLTPVEMNSESWTWLPFIFAPVVRGFKGVSTMAKEQGAEELFKEAATLIYDPESDYAYSKWTCPDYKCMWDKVAHKKEVTFRDILLIARHTHRYSDFQTVRNRYTGKLSTSENCELTEATAFERKLISKTSALYWNLVEFYKKSCRVSDKGYGMTKAQLIADYGAPTKGYQVNADTEMISFSRLDETGEKVITTDYTLDRGIVTHIK